MHIELHGGTEEWSALYVDGHLDTYGDHYLCEERIHQLCGVRFVDDDAWLLGGHGRPGEPIAQTLDEVTDYAVSRGDREATAQDKREEAARLLAEAEELER